MRYEKLTSKTSSIESSPMIILSENLNPRRSPTENAGSHSIASTDPGSGLEEMSKELKFREIFLNDHEIGGRYSALAHFGLVPAALVDVEFEPLL